MSLKSKAASLQAIDLVRKAIRRPPTDDDGLPDSVVDWLARLRLLCNVPFAYLVPDHRLLPTESIRFFISIAIGRTPQSTARSRWVQ